MRRRDVLAVFAGLAVLPSLSRAYQTKPVIGFLSSRSPGDSAQVVAAFSKGLAEAGYVEARKQRFRTVGPMATMSGFRRLPPNLSSWARPY
jgi:hypothetical protein